MSAAHSLPLPPYDHRSQIIKDYIKKIPVFIVLRKLLLG